MIRNYDTERTDLDQKYKAMKRQKTQPENLNWLLPETGQCKWPETVDNKHRFTCENRAESGQPYCSKHLEIAWQRQL